MEYLGINESEYYDFTGKRKAVKGGTTVWQIVATKNLPRLGVKKGDIGGYIQNTDNLTGGAWAKGNAVIMGNANLDGGAIASKNALVKGHASVTGKSVITDDAVVSGKTKIMGGRLAQSGGSVLVGGRSTTEDSIIVATPWGEITIRGNARISNGATLLGGIIDIKGSVVVSGHSLIQSEAGAFLSGHVQVLDGARIITDEEELLIEGDVTIS